MVTQSSALSTQNLLLVVAGERRLRAAQLAGLATVPGICVEGNPSEIALVEIARKKQARGMQTAYSAYKAKQQKGKATRQKKDPNDSKALFGMMNKAIAKLQSIDTSAWTDEERANFQTSLANLRSEIENHQAL